MQDTAATSNDEWETVNQRTRAPPEKRAVIAEEYKRNDKNRRKRQAKKEKERAIREMQRQNL